MQRGKEMDLLDIQVIELLMKDANVTSEFISKQLNVNSSSIRRRIKNLIDQKIISIKAIPNLERLGLPIIAFVSLEVSHTKIKTVLNKLSDHPRTAWVGATSGLFNIRTVWWLNSTEELFGILENEIGKIDGVLRIETSISLQTGKQGPKNFKDLLNPIGNS